MKRNPYLTAEQAYAANAINPNRFARAIERAHGITQPSQQEQNNV